MIRCLALLALLSSTTLLAPRAFQDPGARPAPNTSASASSPAIGPS